MTTMLVGVGLALTPLLLIGGLLALAEWRDRRRAARYARQIGLTEAIHRELGAAAAPVVPDRTRRAIARQSHLATQPVLGTSILRITEKFLGAQPPRPPSQFRIVLTPTAPKKAAGLTRPARPRAVVPRTPIPAVGRIALWRSLRRVA